MQTFMLWKILEEYERGLGIVVKGGQAMMLKIINDIAKEVAMKTQERLKTEGGDLQTIISEELLNEVQKKSRKLTDQSKASDHNKNIQFNYNI